MTRSSYFDIIFTIDVDISTKNKKGIIMDSVEQVAAELAKHEAVCAERWKTIFNKIDAMEKGASDRFNGIDDQVSRIETILLGCAGFLLVSLIGVVGTMITMH